MFLSQEQIDLLTHKECQEHLNEIAKQYDLNKPLQECWKEVWPILDDIVDTILYLEDRMSYLVQSNVAQNANATRYGRDLKELI